MYLCHFFRNLQAIILEGKYWKRKCKVITAEYKKWRRFNVNKEKESSLIISDTVSTSIFYLILGLFKENFIRFPKLSSQKNLKKFRPNFLLKKLLSIALSRAKAIKLYCLNLFNDTSKKFISLYEGKLHF